MPLGSGKDQQAEGPRAFSQRRAKPPVGCSSPGRRQSRSLHQQSHPTRVVAEVDILRHTSAHKGSPLFRRRAPAPNTVDPRGLLTARHDTSQPARRQETSRHRREHLDQWNRGRRDSWRNGLLISRACHRTARRAHRCRRRRVLGSPAGYGRLVSPVETAGVARGFVGVRTPCGKLAACAAARVCLSGYRSAAFPCSPDSGCMTRKRCSCRCAGAWVRRTVGRMAKAAA